MKFLAKVAYGVGQLSDGVKQAAFSTFIFFYYNQVLGLSGSLAGLAALLALVLDGITDPMIGQLSDRLRSRWGRRHPFMMAAVLPFGVAMFMMFSPPSGLQQWSLFAWMLGAAVAVRLSLTLFYIPHLSLGAELVRDYHERTVLISYRMFFTYVGVILTTVLGFAVFFPASETFPNGLLNQASYPRFGLFCALVGSAGMLYSALATRFAIGQLAQQKPAPADGKAILAFLKIVRTLELPSFRIVFCVFVLFCTTSGIIQTLLVYVASFVLGFGPEHLAGLSSSVILGILLAPWVAQKFSRRWDKKRALAIAIVLGSTFAFSPITFFLLGVLDMMSAETKFVFVFIMNGVSQIFFIAYMVLLDSMLSDVIDENELNTGHREEGLFFSAKALAGKASFGLGSFIAGVGLDIIAFPRNAHVGEIASEAILGLAILAGPVMLVLYLLTLLISNRYTLNEARHRVIVASIRERQQKPS